MVRFLKTIVFLAAFGFWMGCGAVTVTFDVKVEGQTTIQKGTLLEQLTSSFGFDFLCYQFFFYRNLPVMLKTIKL